MAGNLTPAIFVLKQKSKVFFDSIEQQQDKYVVFFRYIDFSQDGALLNKNFKFHEKNRHKIAYKRKLCNIKENPVYVVEESNFEFDLFELCFRSVKKKWFREKSVESFKYCKI